MALPILVVLLTIANNSIVFAKSSTSKTIKQSSLLPITQITPEITLPQANVENIAKAKRKLAEEQRRQEEIEKKLAIRQREIDKINRFLKKQGSPLVGTEIPALLYDLAQENNSDYKILLAISGVESGFCSADFSYNCFGYMNKRKYTSWEEAFRDLVPKISRQYVNRYNTDFVSLAKAYGVVNWEYGAQKLQRYYSELQ